MSDWTGAFGKRAVSPQEAVSRVSSGQKVVCGLTEPTDLLMALAKEDVSDVTVVDAVLVFGGAAVATAGGRFRVIVGFATPVSYELQKKGLVEALRLELATLEAQGIGVRLEAATYERQSREREEILLRVAQEALANVAKHAGAKEVSVTLQTQPDEVRLSVRDDGRGFDARRAIAEAASGADRARGGLGIASMRERLRAHSGELALESAPGLGTHVDVRMPR